MIAAITTTLILILAINNGNCLSPMGWRKRLIIFNIHHQVGSGLNLNWIRRRAFHQILCLLNRNQIGGAMGKWIVVWHIMVLASTLAPGIPTIIAISAKDEVMVDTTTASDAEAGTSTEEFQPQIVPNLVLTTLDTRLPNECPYNTLISAVYDEDDTVFLFCTGGLFAYSMSTDTLTLIGGVPFVFYDTQVWAGNGKIYRFEWKDIGTEIWEIHTDNPSAENWQRVSHMQYNFGLGTLVWDQFNDNIYLFAGNPLDPTVKKFSTTSHQVYDAGQVPQALDRAGAVWVPEHNSSYILGGVIEGYPSSEILKYDHETETVEPFGNFPVPQILPCVAWTGREALVLCGDQLDYPDFNFLRFDPFTNEVRQQIVEGWDSMCRFPGCVYSNKLDRVYIFGGSVDGSGGGAGGQPIMYIDLNTREGSSPSTTEEPWTSTTTTTTTTTMNPTTTTTPKPTTETPPGEPDCSAEDKYGTRYEAVVGEYAFNPCPGSTSHGTASWFCMAKGMFNGTQPDYSNCTSSWLKDAQEIIEIGTPIASSTASDVLLDVQRHLQDALNPLVTNVTYFGHEITTLFQIGNGIVDLVEKSTQLSEVEQVTGLAFGAFNQVLKYGSPWEELTQRGRAQSATLFIQASDNIATELGERKEAPSTGYRKEYDTFEDDFVILAGAELIPPPTGGGNGNRITFPVQFNSKSDSYIEIPDDWAKYFREQEVQVSFSGVRLNWRNASDLFPPPTISRNGPESSDSDSVPIKILNGPLMSFTFATPATGTGFGRTPTEINFTGDGVRITFHHEISAWGPERAQLRRRLHNGEEPKAVAGSGVCVYWDANNLSWSSSGCHLISSTLDTTICECNHLTAFAVIMDLHDYIGKSLALEILTWILCSLSIICLVCTIVVLLYSRFKKQLMTKHPRNVLTLYLCIALLVSMILILATMDKHNLHLSDSVCTAFAIVLHYTLLCAFAWMALEGILLGKLVFVNVFATGKEYAKLELLGALLIPALIVGITCGVNFGRGDHAYGNDAFCWLHGQYLWSFISIVAIVLIFNACVLIMSIRKSYLLNGNPDRRVVQRAKSAAFWIRGALSLTIVMGLTWIAGFLMLINNATVANIAAYIFTVLNASQGIFIFVLHVLSNNKVRSHFLPFSRSTPSTAAAAGGAEGVMGPTTGNGNSASYSRTTLEARRATQKRKGTLATSVS